MKTNILNKAVNVTKNKVTADQSAIDKIEAYIDSILEANASEIRSITNQIEEHSRVESEAERELQDLSVLSNADSYARIVAKRDLAKASKEALIAKKKDLEEKPIITADDYYRLVREVNAAFNAENLKTRKRLASLSDQMHEETDKLRVVQSHADSVLYKLQAQAYKFNDCTTFDPRTGNRIVSVIDYKRCYPGFTLMWGDAGVHSQAYINTMRGELEPLP